MKKKDGAVNKILTNQKNAGPLKSFYALHTIKNNNELMNFETLKNKKILMVNTASNCGYTKQYDELEELYQKQKDKLTIIAFPANDFGEQEKGSNEEIAQFCKINYGITFPLMKKSGVVKSETQNEVYKWLTDKNENGWNDQQPVWNFCKYLVDENGTLVNFFGTSISPLSDEVLKAIS
jgi:glutathione peroxidase